MVDLIFKKIFKNKKKHELDFKISLFFLTQKKCMQNHYKLCSYQIFQRNTAAIQCKMNNWVVSPSIMICVHFNHFSPASFLITEKILVYNF